MTLNKDGLEAAKAWFDAEFNGLPDTATLTHGVVSAYFAALPAPDGLVERLLVAADGVEKVSFDRRSLRRGYENILREAATVIQTLQRERDELAYLHSERDQGDKIVNDRLSAVEQQVRDMREGLQFYADPKTYQEPTRERWAADNPGKDPTVAIRCGRFSVEARPGHVVAPIYLDDAGRRARLLLKEGGE